MAPFGKPDATGRSSGKRTGRDKKLRSPPQGEPWVWLTRELIASPAWRAMGINARRLIDFLLIEHMNHAGTENGNLQATYDQLAAFGLTRRKIFEAITEAEALGLIAVEHGGRWNLTNRPSTFRLTFYSDRHGNPATNVWKRVTPDMLSEIHRHLRQGRKQKSMLQCETTVPPQVKLRAIVGGNAHAKKPQKSAISDPAP